MKIIGRNYHIMEFERGEMLGPVADSVRIGTVTKVDEKGVHVAWCRGYSLFRKSSTARMYYRGSAN
jgi:hypothetical protein